MSKTGFFNLPYEIRLSIYELVLPADRMLTHSSQVPQGEKTFRSAGKADDRLKRELGTLVRKHCGLRIVVSPSAPLTTAMLKKCNLEFAAKTKIEIVLDHYDSKSPEKSLLDMDLTLHALAGKLWEYDGLNDLSVRLNDSAGSSDIQLADPYWCYLRPMPRCGHDFVAKTTRTNGIPIVEYLFRILARLPPCKTVRITPPKGLAMLPYGAGFDKRYMRHLCRDLEDRLKARHPNRPFWSCWGRLEALRQRARDSQRPYSKYRLDLWRVGEDGEVQRDEDFEEDFDDTWVDY